MEVDSELRHHGHCRHISRGLISVQYPNSGTLKDIRVFPDYLRNLPVYQKLFQNQILAGLFGMGGAVRGLFLTSFDLPKAVYIATAGAIALTIDTTRLTTYFAKGARLPNLLLWGLLLFIPASFLGAKIAQRIVGKIRQKHFRQVVAVFLFLVGIKLLLLPK
jgi:uncharacterized membrane protein YfcA